MEMAKTRVVLLASVALGSMVGFSPVQAQTSSSLGNGQGAGSPLNGSPKSGPQTEPNDGVQTPPNGGDGVGPASATSGQTTAQSDTGSEIGDIIVTAQKRSQSINNVGQSITAVTGEALASQGVFNVSQLPKLVSAFSFNLTPDQSPVYTIRGVGYQDGSLAASPTVTVYVDEVPIPYSNATLGASLDPERVEVLKGPQGTIFGGNATGGAVNYIAAKPSNRFTAGFTEDFGRFATSNLTAFVSGPITDTLSVRLSGRWLRGGSWQESYTRKDSLGRQNQLYGRFIADWRPVDKLRIELSVNGWQNRSETQAAQLFAKQGALPIPLDPAYVAFPFAPNRARAADWNPGFDFRQRSRFKQVTGRLDYEVNDDLSLTSLSSYQDFKRYTPVDLDGTSLSVLEEIATGRIKTFYQELRASLAVAGSGNITVGANYQHDDLDELNILLLQVGTNRIIGGTNFQSQADQVAESKAVFASGELPISSRLSAVAGVRYSKTDRSFSGCTKDSGDGQAATAFNALLGTNAQRGGCLTIQANLQPGLFISELNEDNVSWRGGLNYKPDDSALLYANVSRGFKAGGFQSLPAGTFTSLRPVVQEQLTAYEAGFKIGLFDRRLQLNGAAFFYDYKDKQIRSISIDPITGSAEALLNIPKSRVTGFELSASIRPLNGLSLTSSVALVDSKVRGSFTGVTPSSVVIDLRGQAFPYTPKWSGNTDAEYRWSIDDRLQAVLGATGTYATATNGGFGDLPAYRVRGYLVLDLRAGIEGDGGKWRIGVWGRNLTNQYYWSTATRTADGGVRYAALPITYGVSLGWRY